MHRYALCKLCQHNKFFSLEIRIMQRYALGKLCQHSKLFSSESCSTMHCANSVNTASSSVQNHAALSIVQTLSTQQILQFRIVQHYASCQLCPHNIFFSSESCSTVHRANSVNTTYSSVQNHAALCIVQTLSESSLWLEAGSYIYALN